MQTKLVWSENVWTKSSSKFEHVMIIIEWYILIKTLAYLHVTIQFIWFHIPYLIITVTMILQYFGLRSNFMKLQIFKLFFVIFKKFNTNLKHKLKGRNIDIIIFVCISSCHGCYVYVMCTYISKQLLHLIYS